MKRLLTALAIVFAAALIVGGIDLRSSEVTAANERSVADLKTDVKPADQVWLMLPLECQQWIAKCSAGQVCKKRYTCAADLTKRSAK